MLMYNISIGGDQLTVARIRGSQRVLFNSENGREHLEGFIPMIEDWHTKYVLYGGKHVY